jgi:hypothetical protein
MRSSLLSWFTLSALLASACSTPVRPADDVAPAPDASPAVEGGASMDATTPTVDASVTPDAQADVTREGPPTWWRDVKPLVDQHCNNCHAAGGIGPMELVQYEQARGLSRVIARQTRDRIMPPWMPREGCRDLRDSRALTDAEIATFAAWDAAGAPEGDRSTFAPASPRTNVTRPLPARDGDIVVQPPESYLPNQRLTDDYRCFVMDPGLTESRDVVGIRVQPGNARIVHHVILFEVREAALGALQRLDDAEPGPGYTCYGDARVPPNFRQSTTGDLVDMDMQMVVGWAPGGVAGYLPTGTGIRLKPRSRLVMQVHYNLQAATRGMNDRSRVDLFLGERGATQQALWLPQANQDFMIPAGVGPTDPRATATSDFRVPLPVRIFGVAPHMHTRGYSIRAEARSASGASTCLVDVPRWDFHWQQGYFFTTPFRPAVGAMPDALRTTCVWDNRPENQPFVDGMQLSPSPLRWGEGTNDEMCINFFYVSI